VRQLKKKSIHRRWLHLLILATLSLRLFVSYSHGELYLNLEAKIKLNFPQGNGTESRREKYRVRDDASAGPDPAQVLPAAGAVERQPHSQTVASCPMTAVTIGFPYFLIAPSWRFFSRSQ
jgi:hypothetical protein